MPYLQGPEAAAEMMRQMHTLDPKRAFIDHDDEFVADTLGPLALLGLALVADPAIPNRWWVQRDPSAAASS